MLALAGRLDIALLEEEVEAFSYTRNEQFALYFARKEDKRFLYDEDEGKWYIYNGRFWECDPNGLRVREAIRCECSALVRWFADKVNSLALSDGNRKRGEKEILKMSEVIDNVNFIEQIQKALMSKSGILVKSSDFDADPFLINTPSGVVNVETLERTDHSPNYLMKLMTAADYDESCDLSFWERIIYESSGSTDWTEKDRREQAEYIKKALGYTILGEGNTEQLFFFVHGRGRTGKNTVFESAAQVLGDYGAKSDSNALTKTKRGGNNEAERTIKRIVGKRLVMFDEFSEYSHIEGDMIKKITGGDTMQTRSLYSEADEERIFMKPWLISNWKIGLNANDDAVWRRIIPIIVDIPKPEPSHKEKRAFRKKMEENRNALLTLIIKSAHRYLEEGLEKPDCIKRSIELMQNSQNYIALFLQERTVKREGHTLPFGKLYDQWKEYSVTKGYWTGTELDIYETLEKAGVRVYRNQFGLFAKDIAINFEGKIETEEDDEYDYLGGTF